MNSDLLLKQQVYEKKKEKMRKNEFMDWTLGVAIMPKYQKLNQLSGSWSPLSVLFGQTLEKIN